MKSLFRIMRSTIASFLFLILILFLCVHYIFTLAKTQNVRLSDLIDSKSISTQILENEKIDNSEILRIINSYIEDYKDYVFYKRSYPSLQSIKMDNLSEEEIRLTKLFIEDVKSKIDIDYEHILTIRKLNNFLSNGAIYLLINIGVVLLILLISIVVFDFKKGFQAFGLSSIVTGIVTLLSSFVVSTKLSDWLPDNIYTFVSSIISDDFMGKVLDESIIYICIGLILFLSIFLFSRLYHKSNDESN